ncbi:hypothetical protein FHR71_002942 [Methylobacterium sp. RAS18]|nr:hypothetical protein [Methylobacterium sp. RAS18]
MSRLPRATVHCPRWQVDLDGLPLDQRERRPGQPHERADRRTAGAPTSPAGATQAAMQQSSTPVTSTSMRLAPGATRILSPTPRGCSMVSARWNRCPQGSPSMVRGVQTNRLRCTLFEGVKSADERFARPCLSHCSIAYVIQRRVRMDAKLVRWVAPQLASRQMCAFPAVSVCFGPRVAAGVSRSGLRTSGWCSSREVEASLELFGMDADRGGRRKGR